MSRQYKTKDYGAWGLPFMEIEGEFSYQDIYDFVGKFQFMTSFCFREGSSAHTQYGEIVTGVVFYDSRVAKHSDPGAFETDILKVDSPMLELSIEQYEELKYGGINIPDIQSISFLAERAVPEVHETGEKKIPDIIEIPIDTDGVNVDRLCQSYLISKNNGDVELISFEKEQLIGITLAFNNGHIDSRILKHLGFTVEAVRNNMNVWFHLYQAKERNGTITEKEKKKYQEIKEIKDVEALNKLMQEMIANEVNDSELKSNVGALKIILETLKSFKPAVLLHGKKQVYWDLNSYIHIAMRHIKDFQMGAAKQKTSFSYKAEDLRNLIEGVLERVKHEYQRHSAERPASNFTRAGAMAVLFNGDYYALRIEPDGRLIQFHTLEKGVVK